jgi:uncharacterized membrane protein YphA (DoxX/SURF4 family)
LIATIQLVGGLAILAGFKTRWVAYALLSAVFIVYGWFAFADIKAWVNFNQAAFASLSTSLPIISGTCRNTPWSRYITAQPKISRG